MSNVTKRTIDYYTSLGLLSMERSASNYRYYDVSMVERIQWIEQQKAAGKSLEQIRANLEQPLTEETAIEIDVQDIRLQMRKLETDVATLMNQLDEEQIRNVKKRVSPESVALMQSLVILLN